MAAIREMSESDCQRWKMFRKDLIGKGLCVIASAEVLEFTQRRSMSCGLIQYIVFHRKVIKQAQQRGEGGLHNDNVHIID